MRDTGFSFYKCFLKLFLQLCIYALFTCTRGSTTSIYMYQRQYHQYLHVPEVVPPVRPVEEQESKRKHEAASFVYFHGLVDGRVGPATGVRFDQSNRTIIIIQCYTTQPHTPAPTWRRRKSPPLPYLLVSNHSEIGKL